MSNVKHSLEELIGNTPIFEVDAYEKANNLDTHILLKVESVNPLGSLKDRIAVSIIDAFERDTDIKPGDYIVEASSGNTVIALAAIARKRGYKLLAIVEQMTPERIKLLEAYDAEIVDLADEPGILELMPKLSDEYRFHDILRDFYAQKSKETGHRYFVNPQWANKANPEIQYQTGQEILRDVDGPIDVLVAGIGSGGSIRGVGDALREANPNLEIVAIDSTPEEPDSLVGLHKIVGNVTAMLPVHVTELEHDIYNKVITVTKEEAYKTANDLAKTEGILFGISTGAAIHTATLLSKQPEYAGKTIVTFAYDDALKYLSTDLVSPQYR